MLQAIILTTAWTCTQLSTAQSQLTHNVVTTLLERCSLVRSDLTFRQRPHDVRRVTTYITTLYERFSNVTLQRYVEVLTQRCHNVVRTSWRSYNSRVISGYLHITYTISQRNCVSWDCTFTHLQRPVQPFLHPHLTSSRQALEIWGEKVWKLGRHLQDLEWMFYHVQKCLGYF